MKANAPEKLYVDAEDRLSDSILYGFTKKRKDDDIEYVRKDVLLEWAKIKQTQCLENSTAHAYFQMFIDKINCI